MWNARHGLVNLIRPKLLLNNWSGPSWPLSLQVSTLRYHPSSYQYIILGKTNLTFSLYSIPCLCQPPLGLHRTVVRIKERKPGLSRQFWINQKRERERNQPWNPVSFPLAAKLPPNTGPQVGTELGKNLKAEIESLSHVRFLVVYTLLGSSIHGISGKNTGMSCHFLTPGDLPEPGIKPASLRCSCIGKRILYH